MGKSHQYGGSYHRISKKHKSNQFGGRWRNGGYVVACPNPNIDICITPYIDNSITKIYLATNIGKIYSYDVIDQTFVEECPPVVGTNTIGYHPDGAIYGIETNGDVRRVKLSNGTVTLINNVSIGYIAGACFDSQKALYTLDFTSGLLSKISGLQVLNDINPLTVNNFGGSISLFPLVGGGDITFFDGELYMVGQNTTVKVVRLNFTSPARTALAATPWTMIGDIIDNFANPVTSIIGMTVLNGIVYICNATKIYSLVIGSPNPIATEVATVPGGWSILDASCILESTNS